jgi:protein dithiol oxidoreductase (disulfide-forming)
MLRRDSLALMTLPLLGAAPALAQRLPQEGVHYKKLSSRLPGTPGKIDVLEFFWYGCPVCYAFEPVLDAWVKQLPPTISFRHLHVFFGERTRGHQRLFFTLQAMGVEHQFRVAIFKGIHEQGQSLDTPESAIKLLQPLGLDVAKFNSTWKAFEPKAFSAARVEAANKLASAYGIDGVPSLGVGGQYLTSPAMAATGERLSLPDSGLRALQVVSHLMRSLTPS